MPFASIRMGRAVAAILALGLLISACRGAGTGVAQGGEAAAARFAAALERLAATLGKPAGELESGIKLKMPNATIDDLAAQAERTADEAAALERIAAEQAAREAEQFETLSAIQEAACDALDILEDMSETGPDAQAEAFGQAIVGRLQAHQLEASSTKVAEIWDAVAVQFDALSTDGAIDTEQAAIDLACLA